jgi:hypothetical protein
VKDRCRILRLGEFDSRVYLGVALVTIQSSNVPSVHLE